MPEITNDTSKKSKYWGNTKWNDIEDKSYPINISMDIVNSTDIAKQLLEQNIRFSARNNDDLGIASLTVSKADSSKAMDIIQNAVKEITPQADMQNKSWGNTKYSDIENKKRLTISSSTSAKINLGNLLNENAVSFSAYENTGVQTTTITVNQADFERMESLIKEAMHPTKEQPVQNSPTQSNQQKFSKVTIGEDMKTKVAAELSNRNINHSTAFNTNNKTTTFTVKTEDMPQLNDILMNISREQSHKEVPEQTAPVQAEMPVQNNNMVYHENNPVEITPNEQASVIVEKQNVISTEQQSAPVQAETPVQQSEPTQPVTENSVNPIEQQTAPVQDNTTKITVASDMRLAVATELLNNDIGFIANVDKLSRTASFTVDKNDMEAFNDILKSLSSEKENVAETPVQENNKESLDNYSKEMTSTEQVSQTVQQSEPIQATDENTVKPTELSDTIQALTEMADKKGIDVSANNTTVAKAVNMLKSIDENTFRADTVNNDKAIENAPIDFGDKIAPIFKMAFNNNESKLNRIAEKNDTLNSKIEKNQDRISSLNNRVDTLKHNNSLLTALKQSIPFASGIANKLIEQNNKEIKDITENKIPKREQKIQKHKGKIAQNNVKLAKIMTKHKQLSILNKFITNFKNMNADERREGFISGLSAIAQYSIDNATEKRNNAVTELNSIATNFNKANGKFSFNEISKQNETISKLSDTINKQQNKISKATTLLKNLDKVHKGELLQDTKAVDTAIDSTQQAVANEIAKSDNVTDIEALSENIADSVVETASAVIGEQTAEKNIQAPQREAESTSISHQTELSEALAKISEMFSVSIDVLTALPPKQQEKLVDDFQAFYNKPMTKETMDNAATFVDTITNIVSAKENSAEISSEQTPTVESVTRDNNPLKTVEEAIEVNANNIDGVINNLPTKNEVAENDNVTADKPQSLFSIEQNGEIREFANNGNSLLDLLQTAATSETPYKDLMDCGNIVSSESFAEIEQSEKLSFSVNINFDNNTVDIYKGDIKTPEADRDNTNSSITHYDLSEIRDMVNEICNETSDRSVQEQLFNERLENLTTNNPLKTVEELIEGNANNIDGVINNLPTEHETAAVADNQAEQNQDEKSNPVSDEVLKLLKDMVTVYDCDFTIDELTSLPVEKQEKIAEMYSKCEPFDEMDNFDLDKKVNREVLNAINIELLSQLPVFTELSEQGIEIKDINLGLNSDGVRLDLYEQENYLSNIRALTLTNADNEEITFSGYKLKEEFQEALNDKSNTFFHNDKEAADTVLVREERPENPEPVVTEDKEQKILSEIAAATGFTVSDLNTLPKDMKADIVAEYEFNGGVIESESFSKDIAAILNVDVAEKNDVQPTVNIVSDEKKEKETQEKNTVQQNNARTDEENQPKKENQEKERGIKGILFSLKDLKSQAFAPRSQKNEKERNTPKRNNNLEI